MNFISIDCILKEHSLQTCGIESAPVRSKHTSKQSSIQGDLLEKYSITAPVKPSYFVSSILIGGSRGTATAGHFITRTDYCKGISFIPKSIKQYAILNIWVATTWMHIVSETSHLTIWDHIKNFAQVLPKKNCTFFSPISWLVPVVSLRQYDRNWSEPYWQAQKVTVTCQSLS